MYRKIGASSISPEEFALESSGGLSMDNRWVILARLIPWSEFESEYAQQFSQETGAPAKSFRMALGALIIKEKLGISDRETVEQIQENPYLQYFIGRESYQNEAPFDASMLVHFRKRISAELVHRISKRIVKIQQKAASTSSSSPAEDSEETAEPEPGTNRGKLLLDATCTPADIKYPHDLGLLNDAREHTEKVIDKLYKYLEKPGKSKKPRTYRNRARKDYLSLIKQRRPFAKKLRKAIKKQLQYLRRNLGHIERLVGMGGSLSWLSKGEYKKLLVVQEVYRQQLQMYQERQKKIPDRIVNLAQPHVRAIVRGKAGKPVEFGAKLSVIVLSEVNSESCDDFVSYHDGYVFLERLSWDNFNESGDLVTIVETFKKENGHYPESVHVDRIYRTRANRAWCKERGIRMSGPPLGRPPANISREQKKQAQLDERERNKIEGKFGQGKRRFSLEKVMAKRSETSETTIAISFLVMNLVTLLSKLRYQLWRLELKSAPLTLMLISDNSYRASTLIGKSYHRSRLCLQKEAPPGHRRFFSASPN